MQACKDYINGGMLKDATGNILRFKWHPSNPGDGKMRCVFKCISHECCSYVAKGVHSSGTYWVYVTSGVEHTPTLAKKTRKNACATPKQLQGMRLLINGGAKPASIMATLTVDELDRCKELGEVAPKRVQGGLEGELFRYIDV